MNEENFKKVRSDLMEIFPPESDDPRFRYVKRTWIFPQHIDISVRFAKQMAIKYGADEEICALASLLHDAGLAYKRESADSIGHEERSVEYINMFLPKYGYADNVVKQVAVCALATEPEMQINSLEEKIVRTADGLAHILSLHYFAKVSFSPDWESGVRFLEKKVKKDWEKICFDDERNIARPAYEYINGIVKQYRGIEIISLK